MTNILPEGFKPVTSSNLVAMKFTSTGETEGDEIGTLEVIFKPKADSILHARWSYAKVEAETVQNLLDSDSIGKAFNSLVKAKSERYAATQMEDFIPAIEQDFLP